MSEVQAPATATEASARLTELGADRAWAQRLYSGDIAARQEFDRLNVMVAEDSDKVDVAMSGALPPAADGDLRHMTGLAEMLRDVGIRDEVIRDTLSGGKVTKAEFDMTQRWLDQQLANREFTKKLFDGDPETRQKFTLANIVLSSDIRASNGA